MRQATKEDLQIGNFVMVNYKNGTGFKKTSFSFEGTYTGWVNCIPIWYKKEIILKIYPIIEIKKICEHDDNRIDFGSWCHWEALIVLDENDPEDKKQIDLWKFWHQLRDAEIKKNPMPIPCNADQECDWDYKICKKVGKKFHKLIEKEDPRVI